jgi:hypothetical protein
VALLALCWLGGQLLGQNGRILLRLEALEERLDEIEFGDETVSEALNPQLSTRNPQTITRHVSETVRSRGAAGFKPWRR